MATSTRDQFVIKSYNPVVFWRSVFSNQSLAAGLGVWLLASLAACTGKIGGTVSRGDAPGASSTTTSGPGATTGGAMGPSALPGLPPAMTPPARLHKLTAGEF